MNTRPFLIRTIDGGTRRFAHLDNAKTAARSEARKAFALHASWSVVDTRNDARHLVTVINSNETH